MVLCKQTLRFFVFQVNRMSWCWPRRGSWKLIPQRQHHQSGLGCACSWSCSTKAVSDVILLHWVLKMLHQQHLLPCSTRSHHGKLQNTLTQGCPHCHLCVIGVVMSGISLDFSLQKEWLKILLVWYELPLACCRG